MKTLSDPQTRRRSSLRIVGAILGVAAIAASIALLVRRDDELPVQSLPDQSSDTVVSRLVGTTYPPLAPGFELVSFESIGTSDTATFAFVRATTSSRSVLMLGQRAEPVPSSSGEPWTITDAVEIGDVPPDYVVSSNFCGSLRRRLTPEDSRISVYVQTAVAIDPTIKAIVRNTSDTFRQDIVRAWKADLATRTLRNLPTDGLVCVNENPGG